MDFLLRDIPLGAEQKAFFRRAFKSQGRLPHKITLGGYQASHRAAREILNEHQRGKRTKIRSSKYLNELIEQDHRSIKLHLGPMPGLKRFRSASITIAGIELLHRIRPFDGLRRSVQTRKASHQRQHGARGLECSSRRLSQLRIRSFD